jgi:hypothetical protein
MTECDHGHQKILTYDAPPGYRYVSQCTSCKQILRTPWDPPTIDGSAADIEPEEYDELEQFLSTLSQDELKLISSADGVAALLSKAFKFRGLG